MPVHTILLNQVSSLKKVGTPALKRTASDSFDNELDEDKTEGGKHMKEMSKYVSLLKTLLI